MIVDAPSFGELGDFGAEVCVIGSGPVGLVTALDLARRGLRVLLLESGGRAPAPLARALSAHENLQPVHHHDPELAVARRLGGTSNLWGGRCLPFDPVDFAPRAWPDLPAWPIGPADLAPFGAAACRYLDAGEPVWSEPLPGVAADPAFGWESLERWSNTPRVQKLHGAELARLPNLLVALGATALGFDYDDAGRIEAVEAHLEGPGRSRTGEDAGGPGRSRTGENAGGPGRSRAGENAGGPVRSRAGKDAGGPGRGRLPVRRVILCAGGNESARLLLAEQARRGDLFGGRDGPLGRFYMGHLTGQLADIAFDSAALHDGLDFHVAHGSYVRRRIVPAPETQAAHRLLNLAFWPVVPHANDPAHRSGPLSMAYLALSVGPLGRALIAETLRRKVVGDGPPRRGAHLRNVILDPLRTLTAIPDYLWRSRVTKMRLPGFFLRNPARRYGLEFHSEQLPMPDSRMTLSDRTDRLGLPLLRLDLRFSQEDADSVVRAHDALEDWLLRNRLGRLEYRIPREGRAAAALAGARHGTHQVGTVRMGADRRTAVVDGNCRAFDVPNLHVVSTAVLPTSGQANPTFTAVQLGLRLAAQLAPG